MWGVKDKVRILVIQVWGVVGRIIQVGIRRDQREPGWLGTASGVRAASMGGVNTEGRDLINGHASP